MSSALDVVRTAALTLGFLAVGMSAAGTAAAADPARGEELFYTCIGCHGIDNYKNVYPTYKVPRLGGQYGAYVVAALKGYSAGERDHATMHAQAASMSDQDMADIGAHLESLAQEPSAAPRGTAPEAAGTCVACHGQDGNSPAPTFPKIAGQHKDYIEQALKAYKSQDRKNAIMLGFATALSDDDIEQLAAYYSSQKGLVTAKK